MAGNNSRLQRICRIYNEALNVVCSLLMVLILGAIFLQIFSRKILNDPLTWTEEFSRLAFIWMNCLGSAIVIKEKKHISNAVLGAEDNIQTNIVDMMANLFDSGKDKEE